MNNNDINEQKILNNFFNPGDLKDNVYLYFNKEEFLLKAIFEKHFIVKHILNNDNIDNINKIFQNIDLNNKNLYNIIFDILYRNDENHFLFNDILFQNINIKNLSYDFIYHSICFCLEKYEINKNGFDNLLKIIELNKDKIFNLSNDNEKNDIFLLFLKLSTKFLFFEAEGNKKCEQFLNILSNKINYHNFSIFINDNIEELEDLEVLEQLQEIKNVKKIKEEKEQIYNNLEVNISNNNYKKNISIKI